MTADEVCDQIRRRAGIKRRSIPVRIVTHPRELPPTLRRLGRRTEQREVVVSANWLQKKAPKLWAAVVAGRILNTPDRLPITPLKEGK